MRQVIFVLIAAVSSTVSADVIQIGAVTTGATGPPDAPHKILVRLAYADNPNDSILLTIPDITPADEGTVWTVNEASAASFNFDWARAESFITTPLDLRFSFTMTSFDSTHVPGAFHEKCEPWRCILDFEMDRIEVTLNRFDLDPRRVEYSAFLIGTGRIVPEPLSVWLLLSGVVLHGLVRQVPRRRPRV